MEKIGEVLQQRGLPAANKSGLTPTQPQSLDSLRKVRQSRTEFARAVTALVALKRTANLTEVQIEAWYAVLSVFPAPVLNAAVVEMCLAETRFPEVGDLYTICRRKLPKEYCPMGDGRENDRPSKSEVRAVAERLGLEV